MTDDLVFLEESPEPAERPKAGGNDRPWKILIVDDDEGVHSSTRFALERVKVDGRALDIADVYSAEDARAYLNQHADVAMALVDVVMETDRAGLDLIRWVREDQGNQAIRLVLRTGQPGQAPERDVVVCYDIDDYKTKSELTSQKLFTLIHSSLRSYNHIRALERNLGGLKRILSAAATLYRVESMSEFAGGVLDQMTALLNMAPEAVYCETRGIATRSQNEKLEIVAATGVFQTLVGKDPYQTLPPDIQAMLAEALAGRTSVFSARACVSYFDAREGSISLAYLETSRDVSVEERELIELFARNINLAFCGVISGELLGACGHKK